MTAVEIAEQDFHIVDRHVGAGRRELAVQITHPDGHGPELPTYTETVSPALVDVASETQLVALGHGVRERARQWHALISQAARTIPAGRGHVSAEGFDLDWVDTHTGPLSGQWPHTSGDGTCRSDLDTLRDQTLPALQMACELMPAWSQRDLLEIMAATSASRRPSLAVELDQDLTYALTYRIDKVKLTGVRPDTGAEQITSRLARMEALYEHITAITRLNVTVSGVVDQDSVTVTVTRSGHLDARYEGTADELLAREDFTAGPADTSKLTIAQAADALARGLRA